MMRMSVLDDPEWRKQRSKKATNARWGSSHSPVDLTCITCGGRFSVIHARAKSARFCSPACYHASRRTIRTCSECGAGFSVLADRRKRFCSKACKQASYRRPPTRDELRARVTIVPSGCWLWHKNPERYGHLIYAGITKTAHRVAYEAFKGAIPAGMCVLHSCDTPACINPDHLSLGTRGDNARDMIRKGRSRLLPHV